MDVLKLLSAILVVNIYRTTSQHLYSSFLQILPTGIQDQVQLYYHLSWKQESLVAGTCMSPVCLKVYRMTNKTAQFFGRFADFRWSCHNGCASNDVISDLSHFMFSEVNNYAGVKWEAGEETVVHTFKATDADDISLRFQFSNATHSDIVEDISLNLRTRSDTKRPNVSPAAAVLPIYRVPLGCSVKVNLSPYDGDGDITTCRWNTSIPGANLDKKLCTITLHVTTSNGYVAGQQYRGTVLLEDFSSVPVKVTRNGKGSFTSGPFSSTLVMFTVHVSAALATPQSCSQSPRFEPVSTTKARSVAVQTNYSSRFTTDEPKATFLTVGHGGIVFNNVTTSSSTTETADWTITANDTGIYKTCVMVYSDTGVPGETRCDTVLATDTDACAQNDPCNHKSCAHCTNYWQYHTCSYDNCNDDSLNIGLVVGVVVGSVMFLVAIVTGIYLYLRYIGRKKTKVKDFKAEQ